MKKAIQEQARRLCRHTIIFTATDDRLVVTRALQGQTSLTIAAETGLSVSQVQYRIAKAQRDLGVRFRSEYRSGNSPLSSRMLAATQDMAAHYVDREIAPRFIPLAKPGIPKR